MSTDKIKKEKGFILTHIALIIPAIAVFIVVAIILIRAFVISVVIVNGGSMEPTMKQGEKWIMNRLDKDCAVGDIVVYKAPGSDSLSVSRVVAKEGETVYIDFSTGAVYINGKKSDEPYAGEPTKTGGKYISYLIDSGQYGMSDPIVAESGKVFVMGDNRNNSRDSREFGQIPEENIEGTIIKKLK